MTKHEFKDQLEELIDAYLEDKLGKKNCPYSISFEYQIEIDDDQDLSYGSLCFYCDRNDYLYNLKARER